MVPSSKEFFSKVSFPFFQINLRFSNGIAWAALDNGDESQLSLDADADLLEEFMSKTSTILVGAATLGSPVRSSASPRSDNSFGDVVTREAAEEEEDSYQDYFRGCLGQVRVGGKIHNEIFSYKIIHVFNFQGSCCLSSLILS